MLPKRTLGPSPFEVLPLCMGCWAIGGPFWDDGWMGYGEVEDAQSLRALQRADELGVRYFDTANVYGCGHSERLLGQAFAHRQDIVISDKFGFTFDEAQRKVTGRDVSPQAIRDSCEASLRRLRRDRIEIYGLHLWDYPIDQVDPILETLEALADEGKIAGHCWLTDDPQRARVFARAPHCLAAPQLLNVLESNPAMLALCEEFNLAACARRPLGMGLLTGKFQPDSRFSEKDMRTRFGWDLAQGKQARRLQQLQQIRGILTQDGRTVGQGALAWIWARSPLAVPSPGFKNLAQIEENIGALHFGPLTPQQMQDIETILNPSAQSTAPQASG